MEQNINLIVNEILRQACASGEINFVKCALKSRGVDVNERGESPHLKTPLHLAAGHGHIKICRLLLKQKNIERYAVDGSGIYQPIHLAATGGYVDVVRLFLTGQSAIVKQNSPSVGLFTL